MDVHSIISAIEAFCEAKGYTPATVTQKAVRNSRLYHRLKNGGGCTLLTARRVLDWIDANAPTEARSHKARENSVKAVAAE